jgi:hypothetical protein
MSFIAKPSLLTVLAHRGGGQLRVVVGLLAGLAVNDVMPLFDAVIPQDDTPCARRAAAPALGFELFHVDH